MSRWSTKIERVADRQVRRLVWPLDRPPVKPRQVIVDITDRCYFRCVTCDKWRTKETPPELDTAAWQATLTALYEWLGPFHLSISGGEPLLREDVFALIAQVAGYGGSSNLMTNGWQVDAAMAQRLVAAGLGNLTLSLNGMEAATHDRTRGMAGSHARILAAVDHFQRARAAQPAARRPTLSLNVIIAGDNAGELPALVRWAQEVGIDAVGLQPLVDVTNYQPYAGLADATQARAVPLPPPGLLFGDNGDDAALLRCLEELIALKRAGYPILNTERQLREIGFYFSGDVRLQQRGCFVGLNNFLIDPYGGVRLCYTMQVVGDVRDEAPRAIWEGARAAAVRRQVRACAAGCRILNCNV
jgi:MoaA/NifB/PqqE/SkfB family radical SAM enzyme